MSVRALGIPLVSTRQAPESNDAVSLVLDLALRPSTLRAHESSSLDAEFARRILAGHTSAAAVLVPHRLIWMVFADPAVFASPAAASTVRAHRCGDSFCGADFSEDEDGVEKHELGSAPGIGATAGRQMNSTIIVLKMEAITSKLRKVLTCLPNVPTLGFIKPCNLRCSFFISFSISSSRFIRTYANSAKAIATAGGATASQPSTHATSRLVYGTIETRTTPAVTLNTVSQTC